MSVHHIVGTEAFSASGRRPALVRTSARFAPTRRPRLGVDWRFVGLVALSAILLIAMLARP